jgi:predicted nucleic acid-binding protein
MAAGRERMRGGFAAQHRRKLGGAKPGSSEPNPRVSRPNRGQFLLSPTATPSSTLPDTESLTRWPGRVLRPGCRLHSLPTEREPPGSDIALRPTRRQRQPFAGDLPSGQTSVASQPGRRFAPGAGGMSTQAWHSPRMPASARGAPDHRFPAIPTRHEGIPRRSGRQSYKRRMGGCAPSQPSGHEPRTGRFFAHPVGEPGPSPDIVPCASVPTERNPPIAVCRIKGADPARGRRPGGRRTPRGKVGRGRSERAATFPPRIGLRGLRSSWFDRSSRAPLGMDRGDPSALALLRHLTNPRVLGPAALDGARAWKALESWLAVPRVRLSPEPDGLDGRLRRWSASLDLRTGAWADAYLAAFAVSGGYRLVGFDAGFSRYPELNFLPLRA